MKTKKDIVGRRASKRVTIEIENDDGDILYFEQPDSSFVFCAKTIKNHKKNAISVLTRYDADVSFLLSDAPHGGLVRDYVLNVKHEEPDSPAGLAARILELCLTIEMLIEMGEKNTLPGLTYRLGILTTLAKVYSVGQAEKSSEPRAKKFIDKIVESIYRNNPGEKAKELWVKLKSTLEDECELVEEIQQEKPGRKHRSSDVMKGDRYNFTYSENGMEKDDHIKFGNFQDKITALKKSE